MTATTDETLEQFLDDLVDIETAARILNLRPQTIPVEICKGKLPLTRYRRGRKTFLSKREMLALLKQRAMPAPKRPDAA